MHKTALLLALSGLLCSLPSRASAQGTPVDSAGIQAARATLRSDLRNFVTAQEQFFADHVTYARSLREMGNIYLPSRGVTLVLLASTSTGHSEIAIIDRAPGLVCAMYVGNAPPPLGRGNEGEPVCQGP